MVVNNTQKEVLPLAVSIVSELMNASSKKRLLQFPDYNIQQYLTHINDVFKTSKHNFKTYCFIKQSNNSTNSGFIKCQQPPNLVWH